VYRHAQTLGLAGFVANSPEGAIIEVEGAEEAVRLFFRTLAQALPPLARLQKVQTWELQPLGEQRFIVAESQEGVRTQALVPPDVALCPQCRQEMENPADRRYRYPFTTCTNCGPRFSLVWALPYDRSRTSMACFPLCPDCLREYQDPANRRFHAEPLCCPQCGPTLRLLSPAGEEMARDEHALAQARDLLAAGKILAVKGLGGFQLACRADQEAPVRRLRQRKRRPGKPFAVMVRDLQTAQALAFLQEEDLRLLTSPISPILLAPLRPQAPLAKAVAPGLADVGLMLPTTPLHVELFRQAAYQTLVMTSGNASEEPICRSNREALARLQGLADAFLLHNRDVVRRVDDSVCRSSGQGPFLVRRSRGYVPTPLPLPAPSPQPVLALGGFLQTTVALAVGEEVFCSQHVGDLDTELARAFFLEAIENLEGFLEVKPKLLVADMHPDYPSRLVAYQLAQERGGRVLEVQHHLAHGAAVLGEHGRFPRRGEGAGILALDGTGFGPDGSAWGGELLWLEGDLTWRRLGFCQPLPLLGGEAAVREPWRVALAALLSAGERDLVEKLTLWPEGLLEPVLSLAEGSWPKASGAGRVFEAAGFLLGLGRRNRFEGELAMRLEALASRHQGPAQPWPGWEELLEGPVLRTDKLLAKLSRRRLLRFSRPRLAAEFHASFAAALGQLAARVFPPGSCLALGGGCLINRLLRAFLLQELTGRGFEVLVPQQLPAGDGGLAYGQAVLAVASLQLGAEPTYGGSAPCA
jgi:hydrogenase maturation protein HypF